MPSSDTKNPRHLSGSIKYTVLALLCFSSALLAQSPAPSPGELTVAPCSISLVSGVCPGNPVTGIVVSSQTPAISIGGTAGFTAQSMLQSGSINSDVTSLCSWSSQNINVATINNPQAPSLQAQAIGLSAGTTVIQAQCPQGLTGSATLLVNGAPNIVNPPVCGTPPCPIQNGSDGVPYSFAFADNPSGGTWTVTSGTLPSWATLNSSTGALTGTPNASGTSIFTITVTNGGTASLSVSLTIAPPVAIAALPSAFVDNHECDVTIHNGGVYDITKTFGIDYSETSAGLQQAIADYQAAPDQWWHVLVPHGTVLPITSLNSLLGKPNATKCFVLDSDTPLPQRGQAYSNVTPVCSHQIVDNNNGSSPRNYGCTNDIASMGTLEGQWNPTSACGQNGTGNCGQIISACVIGSTNCTVPPNHYVFQNLEIREQAGLTYQIFMIMLDDGDTTGTKGSSHIHFINDYFHGDATDAGPGANAISTFIKWDSCSFCSIDYSYFDRILASGLENHLLAGHWSAGPLAAKHNWFEGASSPLFTGGAAGTILPFQNVYNYEIRGNMFRKPQQWMLLSNVVLKNLMEFKTCNQCLIDGNIFEYSNTTGGQKGQCFTLTPDNSSAGVYSDNYSTQDADITWTNNICRHAVTGIEVQARSQGNANGGGVSQPVRRVLVGNDLFYDMSPGPSIIYNNNTNIPFVIQNGSGNGGNTFTCAAAANTLGTQAVLNCADGGTGLHQTGISPGDLVQVVSGTCSDHSFETGKSGGNALEGQIALSGTVPGGLVVVYGGAFTPNGSATGCTLRGNQGFIQQFYINHVTMIGTFKGSGAAQGQVTSCLGSDVYAQNVTFTNSLVALLPANYGGTVCQGGAVEGTQSENDMFDTPTAAFNHNAIVGRTATKYTEFPGIGPSSFTVTVTGSGTTVTNTGSGNFSTTWPALTHGTLAGLNVQISTCSTTVCTLINPVPNGVGLTFNVYAGTNPPNTLTFPANVPCANATADPTCFGFSGMMSGLAYEPSALLYTNDYQLVNSSQFKAGAAHQASDGTDMGTNIPAINSEIISSEYTCSSSCGTGPYPD